MMMTQRERKEFRSDVTWAVFCGLSLFFMAVAVIGLIIEAVALIARTS